MCYFRAGPMLSSLRRASADLAFSAMAVAMGLVSLAYPLGRDQGLYFYVAREWVLRGAIPYRDVLDHKTPGIYVLYALGVKLFGPQQWGIRLFDLVGIALIAMAVAELTVGPGERVRSGVRGATHLALSVLYYGYLDFWNTAQSELWYGGFAVAGVAAAYRIKNETRAATLAGLAIGTALVMKPPSMTIAVLAIALLVRRGLAATKGASWTARGFAIARRLAFFGLGAAVVPALVLLYFAAHGAVGAMIDIVVGANGYYVKHERSVTTPAEIANTIRQYFWHYSPLFPALLLYLAVALARSWRQRKTSTAFDRHLVAFGLWLTAFGSVAMQGKYYLLHWTVILPSAALIAANALRDGLDHATSRPWLPKVAFAPIVLVLWLGAMWTNEGPNMWRLGYMHVFRYGTKAEARDTFLDHFQAPGTEFWYLESDQVGGWLRTHTKEGDTVVVRGFQPEIYAIAERHHAGRFFWTTFITNPARAYRRDEWLKEDRDAIVAHPPRYAVALRDIQDGPDSPGFFERLGYRRVETIGHFVIMEPASFAAAGP